MFTPIFFLLFLFDTAEELNSRSTFIMMSVENQILLRNARVSAQGADRFIATLVLMWSSSFSKV